MPEKWTQSSSFSLLLKIYSRAGPVLFMQFVTMNMVALYYIYWKIEQTLFFTEKWSPYSLFNLLKKHDRTVQLLLRNGADINLCDEKNQPPLCSYFLTNIKALYNFYWVMEKTITEIMKPVITDIIRYWVMV